MQQILQLLDQALYNSAEQETDKWEQGTLKVFCFSQNNVYCLF